MNKKELLSCLVIGFSHAARLSTYIPDDDEGKLNDELNRIAVAMEDLSKEVFGEKIDMDFGMIHAIFEDPDKIIKLIDEHELGE